MTLPAALPTSELPAGTVFWRIHRRAHGAVWFGPAPDAPPTFRFDAPAGEYRACYLGDSIEASFVETLVRGSANRAVSRDDLRLRLATPLPLARDVRLARLHSDGLVRLALPADVPHAFPYDECQALALEIWRHSDTVDGIEYRSRWDDSRLCVALFDRAVDALVAPEPPLELSDLSVIRPILRLYDVGVV